MQGKTQTLFTRTIYGDFMRFALASFVAGVTAAALLSSAVLALSSPAPNSGEVLSHASDSAKPLSSGGAV